MTKGYQGESCAEAVRASIKPNEVLSFSELRERVIQRGRWKEETVWQHLMGLIVNLPPARRHWENMQPFLFLRPDGQYEVYNRTQHPEVTE